MNVKEETPFHVARVIQGTPISSVRPRYALQSYVNITEPLIFDGTILTHCVYTVKMLKFFLAVVSGLPLKTSQNPNTTF